MTHVGSDWETLCSRIEENPNIEVFKTGNQYHHPDDVRLLTNLPHKKNNSASIWCDLIFHNKDFTMKHLSEYYRLVFWSKDFYGTKNELNMIYGDQAMSYYNQRLEGMRQYHERTLYPWNPDLKSDAFFDTILGRKDS